MKKFLSALLILTLIFSMTACGSGQEEVVEPEGPLVVMITDKGGIGDEAFNDAVLEGCKKAESDFGTTTKILEAQVSGEFTSNIMMAIEENADLIICVGSSAESALVEAATQYPNQLFAILDPTKEMPANVAGLSFKEEEGSFLVGVAAALTSKSNIVGYIGGVQSPLIEKFQYGFQAGVKAVKPDAKVLVNYTQSFTDKEIGKKLALEQQKLGADVIYQVAGECGIGVIEAAGEGEFWVIGVGKDQSNLDTKHVLCSMVKKVDNATYLAIKAMAEGKFTGENMVYTLSDDGVAISDEAGNIPKKAMNFVEMWSSKIAIGDFEVPYDKVTFDTFKVPAL